MSSSFQQHKRRGWGSRWSFVAATAGATIGLGNLWKFSYLAGDNGGSAFVLVYILCVLLVGLPIMIAEAVLGRRGRTDPVTTIKDISIEAGASRWWQAIAWLGLLAGLLILSYYTVIAGWGMAYVGKMLSGEFSAASVRLAGESFNEFLASPETLLKWQGLFLLAVALVVATGVRQGIAVMARFDDAPAFPFFDCSGYL